MVGRPRGSLVFAYVNTFASKTETYVGGAVGRFGDWLGDPFFMFAPSWAYKARRAAGPIKVVRSPPLLL